MSDRYKGAILSPTAPTVTPQSAGGIYTSSQQLQYQGQGVWPSAVNYPINNSLRFRASASAYLNRTPASAGNRQIWTWSGWVKRGSFATNNGLFSAGTSFGTNNNNLETISFPAGDTLEIASEVSGATQYRLITTQVFRDPSAWYHVVVAIDTTQATSSNRIKLYINGSQVTAFGTSTYPSQNYNCWTNSTNAHRIGSRALIDFNGYMTEVNFIDGVQLTPSSFGTTDVYGIWQPTPYTGAYGTNGFYLPFTDNSALTTTTNVGLGKDFSGNGNYWVTNNISITAGSTYDSMKDVPTNTNSNTANYSVWNPLKATAGTYSNGNLTLVRSSTANVDLPVSTIQIAKTVPVYCELRFGSSDASYGIAVSTSNAGANGIVGSSSDGLSWGAYITTSSTYYGFWNNNSRTSFDFSGGTVYQLAFDQANGKLWFGKDGTWYNSGNPTNGTNPTFSSISTTADFYIVALCPSTGCSVNFGQQGFTYTPPSGFYPLNTYNLPTPTILAGNQYFDATTYTGNGTSLAVTNSGSMQPDFLWIKQRGGVTSHVLQDAVRGAGKSLFSNSTAAESGNSGDLVTSFNSNGFTVNDTYLGGSGGGGTNGNSGTYVGWQWRASNAAGVSNTQGTITSTVSANTTSGFSVVTYTGTGSNATVGHGLGAAPSMVIVKLRSGAGENWNVWHTSLGGNTYRILLNTTGAVDTGSPTIWSSGGINPTSTTFTVGTSTGTNGSASTYVAYCFAAVAGYSAFGSYTGNGSTDGPFVYLGFRPRYVMIKESSGSSAASASWVIFDTARDSDNVTEYRLFANLSDAEVTSNAVGIDILSNGFKLRVTNFNVNESSGTYIYACFAENPFKIARAR